MRIRSVLLSMLLGLVVAVGAGSVGAPRAAADQGWTETAATTYTLDPAHGVLHVAVSVKVTNTTPTTTSASGVVTTWYLTSATIWVENEATGIRATSGGTRLATSAGSKGTYYRTVAVTYPKLYYGGTRTIVVAYDIRGGAPRSVTDLRLLRAYVNFCVIANGIDSGSIRVSVPTGYSLATTGTDLARVTRGNRAIYLSGSIEDTTSYWTCFSGTNTDAYTTERLAAQGGRVIWLESWPEDGRWTRAVKAEIKKGIPALEALVGQPMPGSAPIFVREYATGSEYAGFYNADTGTVTVGEDYAQPSLVEHELAHTWFNLSSFVDRWVDEGSAEWAGRTTSGEQGACVKPSSGQEVTLSDWKFLTPKSTRAERDAVDTQYETACYVVSTVAVAAGRDRTVAALAALFARHDPYAASPSGRRSNPVATWRDWLDAMDELALQPAGASGSLATDLVLAYGVTTDRPLLVRREAVRTAYHQLIDRVQGWVVPAAVREPLAAWDFPTAGNAISAADAAWTLTGEADQALPGIDARHGPAAVAWAAATTVDELTAAGTAAQAQLDAAKDVAATEVLAAAPLDVVAQVGLMGTSIASLDPAVGAVKSGDTATATRLAASVRDTVNGLHDAGQARVAAALGVVVGLLVLMLVAGLLLRRRSRRRVAALASSAVASFVAPAAAPLVAPDWPQPPPAPPPPLLPPPPPTPPSPPIA